MSRSQIISFCPGDPHPLELELNDEYEQPLNLVIGEAEVGEWK